MERLISALNNISRMVAAVIKVLILIALAI